MSDIVIPGKRRNIDRQSAADMMAQCDSMWEEQRSLGLTPLGFMRQDAYWAMLETVLQLYMQPTRGGAKWDNRRKSC